MSMTEYLFSTAQDPLPRSHRERRQDQSTTCCTWVLSFRTFKSWDGKFIKDSPGARLYNASTGMQRTDCSEVESMPAVGRVSDRLASTIDTAITILTAA
jgi:hypothetical protein